MMLDTLMRVKFGDEGDRATTDTHRVVPDGGERPPAE